MKFRNRLELFLTDLVGIPALLQKEENLNLYHLQ